MIDVELLEKAFNKVASERMMSEIRDWFIHTAPKDVLNIYGEYERMLVDKKSEDINIDEK